MTNISSILKIQRYSKRWCIQRKVQKNGEELMDTISLIYKAKRINLWWIMNAWNIVTRQKGKDLRKIARKKEASLNAAFLSTTIKHFMIHLTYWKSSLQYSFTLVIPSSSRAFIGTENVDYLKTFFRLGLAHYEESRKNISTMGLIEGKADEDVCNTRRGNYSTCDFCGVTLMCTIKVIFVINFHSQRYQHVLGSYDRLL